MRPLHVPSSKLFVGVLAPKSSLHHDLGQLTAILKNEIGTVQEIWADENGWLAPESYIAEMGEDLSTAVIVFDGLWHPRNLAFAKWRTVRIENQFRDGNARTFNLNPGMIDGKSMRLASHKPSPLRYKLTQDVWVEEQMVWSRGKLAPHAHAFQEYLMGERYDRLSALGGATITEQTLIEGSVRPMLEISLGQRSLNFG
jgi:hypothetical protein